MPKVLSQGKTIECVSALAKPLVARASPTGEHKRLVVRHRCTNLRKVLLHNSIDLYNGGASFIKCRGIGTWGTCAVKEVEGEVSGANSPDNARRWSVCCQAFSFVKRLPCSEATGQPLLDRLGNKTRTGDRTCLPILLHQTYVRKAKLRF